MQSKPKDIALLLFIRTPHVEVRHKRLLPSASLPQNQRLIRRLNQHAISLADASGLPTFILDSPQQQGDRFGERLANAFQDIYAQGYRGIVAIGNDCLQLETQDLLDTAHALQETDIILGPTLDGGVHTIGMQRSAFDFEAFCNLPWQTNQVQQAWQQYVQHFELPAIHWLRLAADIDYAQDLVAALRSGMFHNALFDLLSLLAAANSEDLRSGVDIPRTDAYLLIPSHRGPPRVQRSILS